MKKKIIALLMASLLAFPMSASAKENFEIEFSNPKQETIYLSESRSNRLAYGYISNIYLTDNPDNPVFELECQVLINDEFEEYLAYSYGEDWYVGDTVLLVINDKGTEDKSDDVVRDVIYVNPEFENQN